MEGRIGDLLADTDEFYEWAQGTSTALAALITTVQSGLPEVLRGEPRSIEDLAKEIDLPPDKLARLVNFLAAHRIVVLDDKGLVVRTSAMDGLQQVADALRCIGIGSMSAGPSLYPALKQGISAFEYRHGKPVFVYLKENTQLSEAFAGYMNFLTRRLEKFVFSQHRFEPFKLAVDLGGSHGGLLLKLLAHHAGTRGILFDLPDVIGHVANAVRSAPEGSRVELIGGSFFNDADVPQGDLYLLKHVLHDWNDTECLAILKNVRKKMKSGSRLAVIEFLLPEVPEPSQSLSIDIGIMIWATGRERRLSEFEALFEASGLKLDRVSENSRGQSVFEAVPV